ncbi:penicillin-binding protein [Cohnella sp. CFH 77786]|uniref:peptidoglycan D,D-transpeptidase FtsI family protein n=1 Tax=Cohnella sp. CFH 77786 TaxID=2662265 RepID=UPI001C6104BE|nr:penicillin-binding transpeptidase domain-containing protein [Cohnella sp. CFH 77786]MBW5444984.1 penicillin-binding protein [Cohnella sp. CFH 77786]
MDRYGRRRLLHLLLLLSLLFCAACARLAWMQLGLGSGFGSEPALSRRSVTQRSEGFAVDSGRGQFADRKGRPITGVPIRSFVAFPDYGMPRGSRSALRQAAKALGTSPDKLEQWLKKLEFPEAWRASESPGAAALTEDQAEAVRRAGLLGVSVLPYRNRYPAQPLPLHAIGYLSQDPARLSRLYPDKLADHRFQRTELIGGAGMEKSLDRFLHGLGPTVVSQFADAAGRPLSGLGLRTSGPGNPHYPLQVRTTLDLDIQREAEEALAAAGVRQGAAVVLDAADADILAMVSLPRMNPYAIGEPGTDERNHAITAFPPGSVFKAVTLAAALESGKADLGTKFRCDGAYGRYGLKCWRHEGHGELTLEEAFAESCNVAFAALAERLDPAWIQITADRLGLGRKVGWFADSFIDGKPLRLLGEEEPGTIFASKKAAQDGGVRTGTGIGQRDVRVSPLQAANLVVSLLHGGRVFAPRIVSEIRYADGGLAASISPQASPSRYGKIRPETAAAVLTAMRAVVTEGTARGALASSRWPLAGKSGTAELAGKSKARRDHWFVGYGPAKGKPKYAVAILIEEQPAGLRNKAAAAFGELMERLRLSDRRLPVPGTAAGAEKR